MANANDIYRIYAQIVSGVTKEQTTVELDDELNELWDGIAEEVEEIKAKNPGAVFDIPSEMPEVEPRF